MRKLLLITAVSIFVIALASMAMAGGAACTKSAGTASTASAAGCCAKGLSTASAAGCTDMKGAHASIAIETVRMPSGALAIFYNGADAATVATLQTGAKDHGANFGCGLAAGVAANENCKVEVANTEHGIMMLVSSPKTEVIDAVAAQYQVAVAAHAEKPAQGGE